jgi:hypothetical protein
MYIYHKTQRTSNSVCECENRSLLRKGRQEGQKSHLTQLDWASICQSSETADPMADDAKLANELGVSLEDERDLHFGGWCGLFSVKGKPIVQCGSGAKRFGIDFPKNGGPEDGC